MEIKARFVDIPALLGFIRHDWRDAFLLQRRLLAKRLPGKMSLQARHIGFRGHFRQIQPRFGNADRADPFRKIIGDDPIGAFDPFT